MAEPPPRPRGRPPQEGLAELRKSQIIEAAFEVFTEQGFQATTVASIAKRAGIGQGTVYRYFDSKIEILREVFDYTVQNVFATLDVAMLTRPIDDFDQLAERIAGATTTMAELVREDPRLLRILAVEASAADEELQHRVIGLERMLAGRVTSMIGEGIARGQMRSSVNAVAYGHLVMSLALPIFVDVFHARLSPALRDRHAAAAGDLIANALRATSTA